MSVDAVRKANGAKAQTNKDRPTLYHSLPGQPAAMLFVPLDEIAPSLAELLDEQAAIIGRLNDHAKDIAALANPSAIEAALVTLWREMRDAMLAANESCGFRYVGVIP